MKLFLKLSYLIVFAILIGACDAKKETKGDLADYVPKDASVVLKISDLDNFKSEALNNELFTSFRTGALVQIFSEKDNIFEHLSPKKESLLCLQAKNDSITDYVFITRLDSTFVMNDSIETLLKKTAFTATKDSIFLATSSSQLLTKLLDGNSKDDRQFRKVFGMKNNSGIMAIYEEPKELVDSKASFASQLAFDMSFTSNGISASGVALAQDTIPQLLSAFKGQTPQQNDLESVLPTSAISATSFTFSDAALFINRLQKFRQDSLAEIATPLFESVNEVGFIKFQNSKAVVLKSIDPELTTEELAPLISERGSFREITLFSFDTPALFQKTFAPIIQETNPTIAFKWEEFFIFCESQEAAESMITSIKNNGCVDKTAYFEENNTQLSNASSLLLFALNSGVSSMVSKAITGETLQTKETLKRFPFAAMQYTYDRNFAHVNFVCREASKKQQIAGNISQLFSVTLPHHILGEPQLFTNHRTKGKDVVVQDIEHQLYLISKSGKTLWKKQLSGPILGKIHEIDLLRNGKKQLAFTTAKAFYVLDRNGKEVAPFPKKFNDNITQPLSVFDYENNRKYRFVITQGKNLFMYDSKGKIVSGFKFKKTKTDIVLPPQHLQMGNKDYIAIPEKSGKLNLLSRVGKERVSCKTEFDFSKTPIGLEGNSFVVIDKDNNKHSILASGKVTSKKIKTNGNYHFVTLGSSKVTLDDNLLRINGKLVELPFGIYGRPQLFKTFRKTYVAVTETQEKKVFLFNHSGTLQPGFPVYGTSAIDLSSPNSNKAPLLIVKGEAGELILYSL